MYVLSFCSNTTLKTFPSDWGLITVVIAFLGLVAKSYKLPVTDMYLIGSLFRIVFGYFSSCFNLKGQSGQIRSVNN